MVHSPALRAVTCPCAWVLMLQVWVCVCVLIMMRTNVAADEQQKNDFMACQAVEDKLKKKALISLLPKFYVLCAFNFSSCLFSHTQLFIVCFFSVFSIAILIGVALVVCLPPAPPSRLHHTIYALHIILSSKFPPVCFFAWSLYLYFMCCLLYAV